MIVAHCGPDRSGQSFQPPPTFKRSTWCQLCAERFRLIDQRSLLLTIVAARGFLLRRD